MKVVNMFNHLKIMLAGRSLPSLKTRISVDWKIQIFFLIVLAASQLSLGMQPDQPASGDDWVKEHMKVWHSKKNNALWFAAGCKDLAGMKKLLDEGADPNISADGYYGTALEKAAEGRFFEGCRLLLERGADVNQLGKQGETALAHACCAWGEDNDQVLKICELFVQYGANTGNIDRIGLRAIDYVVRAINMARIHEPNPERNPLMALLSNSAKKRDVIIRADNPNLKKLRKKEKNIFNALMNRELGLK